MDLAVPIRNALVDSLAVTSSLEAYRGSFPVFTKRPVPDDAPKLHLVVSPDVSSDNQDGVNDLRPILVRDVAIYGPNEPDGTQYRAVEALGYVVRDLFHRQRHALTVSGFSVTDVTCFGPIPSPVDDERTVGRVVSLTVRLAKQL